MKNLVTGLLFLIILLGGNNQFATYANHHISCDLITQSSHHFNQSRGSIHVNCLSLYKPNLSSRSSSKDKKDFDLSVSENREEEEFDVELFKKKYLVNSIYYVTLFYIQSSVYYSSFHKRLIHSGNPFPTINSSDKHLILQVFRI